MTPTNEISDRIRLAEAMGWTYLRMKYVEMDGQSYCFGCPPADQYSDGKLDPKYRQQIPDPFTDANDDYAVLEWMREKYEIRELNEVFELSILASYQVGDFARFALQELTRIEHATA